MKPYWPLLLFIFSFFLTEAQPACEFSISGKVTDHHNGEVLSFSVIRISGTSKAVVADSSGIYRLTGLCKGEYELVCTHVGCDPVRVRISLEGNLELNFNPEHHTEVLREYQMSSFRTRFEGAVNRDKIAHAELQMLRGLSLTETLRDIRGITTLSTGSTIGKPVIRGMSGNRIVIMNNGVRQESQQWGTEHAPELDPSVADEIEIVKGASTVLYGPEAMGGAILINPRPMEDVSVFRGQVNTFFETNGLGSGVSFFTEGSLPLKSRWTYRVHGGMRRSGNVRAPGYYLRNTGLFEWNGTWNVAHYGKRYGVEVFYSFYSFDVGIFSAAHLGNLSDLRKAIASDRPLEQSGFDYSIGRPRQEVKHELALVRGYFQLGGKSKIKYDLSRQYNLRREYDKDLPLNDSLASLDPPSLHLEITTWNGNIKYELPVWKSFHGIIGMSSSLQGNTYEGRFFIPNFRRVTNGMYLLERYTSASGTLYAEAGLRADRLQQDVYFRVDSGVVKQSRQFLTPSWSLAFGMKPADAIELRFFTGSAWRAPHVSEWYSQGIHHGTASYETGNPNLQVEQSIMSGALLMLKKGRFELSAEPFYSFVNGFINLEPDQQPILTIRGAFPAFHYVQDDVNLYGADFFAEARLDRQIKLSAVGSLLRARRVEQSSFLYAMPADRITLRVRKDFDLNSRWRSGFVWLGLPYVWKQWRVDPEQDFAPPPEGYFLLQASAGIQKHTAHGPLQFGVSVSNALNTRYRDYLDRFRYFTDAKGISVQFRISIPFLIPFKEGHSVEITNEKN